MMISNALKEAAERTAETMQIKGLQRQEILGFPRIILDSNIDCDEETWIAGVITKEGKDYFIKMPK